MVPALTPLELKPAPVALTPEMVTFAFPLFVRATLSELVATSFTFPNFKGVGLAPSSRLASHQADLQADQTQHHSQAPLIETRAA